MDRNSWQTPEYFLKLVRAVGPIGLDPCAGKNTDIGLINFRERGLDVDWAVPDRTLFFCNPPYGRALKSWTDKILEEVNRYGFPISGVVLTPVRTDAEWWCRLFRRADRVVAWRSNTLGTRISFIDPETGKAPGRNDHASCVFLFSDDSNIRIRFSEVFSLHGTGLK